MNRYLLIDDDDIIHFIHRKVITATDPEAEVTAVFSVEEGLAHLVASAPDVLPDVIFVDISMPILSGFDLLDTLQQDHPELHQTLLEGSRLFLLTSSVNPRDMERAGGYPLISKVLAKPLSPDALKMLDLLPNEEQARL